MTRKIHKTNRDLTAALFRRQLTKMLNAIGVAALYNQWLIFLMGLSLTEPQNYAQGMTC